MLKANKIAEAAQLLQAVAADKSASIEKDRKDVAAAYRNLGAIAGLRDPAKAFRRRMRKPWNSIQTIETHSIGAGGSVCRLATSQ